MSTNSLIASLNASGLGDSLDVVEVVGEEQLSGLFCYVVSVDQDASVQTSPRLDTAVGTTATLTFHRGGGRERSVTGIVSRVMEHATNDTNRRRYELELRPRLWQLTLSRHYRTFTDCKIVQNNADDDNEGVLDRLLRAAGYASDDITTTLRDVYTEHAHLVQHGETDFDLFQRLAAEAGVEYVIDGNDTIYLIDQTDTKALPTYQRVSETGGFSSTLQPATTQTNEREGRLYHYGVERNAIPQSLSVRNDRPAAGRQASESVGVTGPGAMGGIHEYPGGLGTRGRYSMTSAQQSPWTAGPNLRDRRANQLRAAQTFVRCETNARLLGGGMVFEMERSACPSVVEHFAASGNGSDSRLELIVRRLRVHLRPNKGYRAEVEAFPAQTMNPSGQDDAAQDTPHLRGARFATVADEDDGMASEASPYRMRTEASPGPGPGSLSGLHLGTVQDATPPDDTKKKFAMVKVRLQADHDPALEGQEVWARVMGHGGGPGAEWGTQFIPREGATVVVAYPGGSDRSDPIVLGTLLDYRQTSPFYREGDLTDFSGIRTRSDRGDEGVVHNEIRFKDDQGKEEIRIQAPHNRTDFTGLEKDVREKRTYHKRKSSIPDATYAPKPRTYITRHERKALPTRSDPICHMTSFLKELIAEYGSRRRMKEDIDYAAWTRKAEETTFVLRTDEELDDEHEDFQKGVAALREIPACREITLEQFVGDVPVNGKRITESSYNEDPPRAFRKAYTLQSIGQGGYEIEPHQELYSTETIERTIGDAPARRLQYTEGGALDACQGEYRIHTFGDRLEICRTAEDDPDVFDQHATEDWAMGDLPGNVADLTEETPIVVLNKDGSIVLRSTEGISLETAGDINLDAGKNVNINAESQIKGVSSTSILFNAKNEIKSTSKSILLGGSKTNSVSVKGTKFSKAVDEDENTGLQNEINFLSHGCYILGSEEKLASNVTGGFEMSGLTLEFGLRGVSTAFETTSIITAPISSGIKTLQMAASLTEAVMSILQSEKSAVSEENKAKMGEASAIFTAANGIGLY